MRRFHRMPNILQLWMQQLTQRQCLLLAYVSFLLTKSVIRLDWRIILPQAHTGALL